MAVIEGYEYDIFLSYSHIDNEKAFGQAVGWMEQFYKDLSVSLWKSLGTRDIKIWWDEKRLDGGILFDDAIAGELTESAILLCINSPAYLRSLYCKKEREFFYRTAKDQPIGLKVGDRPRIVNVLSYNIPFKEWPIEFAGTTGFPLHDAHSADDQGHPLNAKNEQYPVLLQELSDGLVKLINAFKTDTPPPPVFTIYFSDVSDSLRNIRKRTIAEVEKEGYKIISDVPPPFAEGEHEEAVKEKLKHADFAVHLLDQFPGREIEGNKTIWYPQKQAELVLNAANPQLIWVPQDLDVKLVEEEKYKAFLEGLEDEHQLIKNVDYVRGLKSELTSEIIALAKEIESRLIPQPPPGKISVLLDAHYDDQMYALKLGESLIENQIQPFINPQDDDPLRNINILEDRISLVSKLIFLYGKVTLDWIIERMKAAQQLIISKKFSDKEFFVFMIPPRKEANQLSFKQAFIKVNVINKSDAQQLNVDDLQQFFNNLKGIE